MTKSAKPKARSRPERKPAKARTWSDAMKEALQKKRTGGKGPAQPKPRDSGTFKVKKDAF